MTQVKRSAANVDATAVQALRSEVRGDVIEPGDAAYESARKVYNGMIDRHPRLIVRCADVADVIGCVVFSRKHDLELSIRGGGHNVAGFSMNNDGLVIDLSRMKGIQVDPVRRTVRAQGGCTWGDLDHATQPFNLATTGGVISTTGIAGLTLGGGIGHLTRKLGFCCDNLIAADIVTADGRLLTANERENEDLFWALRGGGGNFGVVTSFEYRLHHVNTVLGGPIFYPIEMTADVLKFYREFIAAAPDDLGAFFAFLIGPEAPFIPKNLQGVPMCAIVACYSGPIENGEEVVKPLRRFGPPALDLLGPMPYPKLQSLFDALHPAGLQHYWKADYNHEISDGAIDIHVKYGPKIPTVQSVMHIYPTNGAPQKVNKSDTAYSFRDANFVHVIAAMYPDPADTEKNMKWVRDYWTELHPYSAGAAYVNFLMDEGEDRIRATYGSNYKRLVAVKSKYDPTNLFHMNQNIRPTT